MWRQLSDELGSSTDLTDQCTYINAADCDHAIQGIVQRRRYHKSGEKGKHFSYPDYFTYPVCQDQPVTKGVQKINVAFKLVHRYSGQKK